ncbi:hypothetical protein N0V94_003825 [Neodidymelliopsis sp. IMI 364377]|nr:hypothetical protein N0V94_003825 [Neodidymelliopsis sp. IMI 364377]
MAIHNNFPGLSVEIVTDGSPLREHDIEEASPTPNTVIKYVETEAGAEFAIRCSFDPRFPNHKDVRFHALADGKFLRGLVIRKEVLCSRAFYAIRYMKRVVDNEWVGQSICFNAVNTTDDAGNLTETLEQSVRNIGEITVILEFGKIGKAAEPRDHATNGFMNLPVVPETALKGEAKSLQVSISEPEGTSCSTPAPYCSGSSNTRGSRNFLTDACANHRTRA